MVKEFITEHSEMLTKDFQQLLQKQVDEYREKLSTVDSLEQLDEMEKEIIDEMKEYDEYINAVEYTLPDKVNFEGKDVLKSVIQGKFIYFVSNWDVTWEFVPTLYTLCNIWKREDTKVVSHGVLDSTIRILGKIKVKGYTEIRDMFMLDRYLDPLIENYGKNTSYQIAMGHRHNEIMKRRQMITPLSETQDNETALIDA